jgi:epoxyqueuosine reductase QueG
MSGELKQEITRQLKQVGAFDVKVADPKVGFEHALEGQHPLELWSECRSIVVFAVACSPQTNNTYIGPYAPGVERQSPAWEARNTVSGDFGLGRLIRTLIYAMTLQAMPVLQEAGFQVIAWPLVRKLQLKLCAVEAGLSVYGRSGITLHPVLGNRIRLGAIMTDAVLEADGGLEGYNPCENCDRCVRLCPGKAYDPEKSYPHSWSRRKCVAKRTEIAEGGLYCHNCFAVCPAGTIPDDRLLRIEEAHSYLNRDRKGWLSPEITAGVAG